jgi:hypothetical protein
MACVLIYHQHSVIKAAYGFPCIPYEEMGLPGHGFFSGFFPVNSISDTVRLAQ